MHDNELSLMNSVVIHSPLRTSNQNIVYFGMRLKGYQFKVKEQEMSVLLSKGHYKYWILFFNELFVL